MFIKETKAAMRAEIKCVETHARLFENIFLVEKKSKMQRFFPPPDSLSWEPLSNFSVTFYRTNNPAAKDSRLERSPIERVQHHKLIGKPRQKSFCQKTRESDAQIFLVTNERKAHIFII